MSVKKKKSNITVWLKTCMTREFTKCCHVALRGGQIPRYWKVDVRGQLTVSGRTAGKMQNDSSRNGHRAAI